MNKDYSSQFIYKPPIDASEKLECEFGTSQPVRFIQKNENPQTTECLDCDAQALWSQLNSLEITPANVLSSMKKLQECLLFVLENVDWPVGD